MVRFIHGVLIGVFLTVLAFLLLAGFGKVAFAADNGISPIAIKTGSLTAVTEADRVVIFRATIGDPYSANGSVATIGTYMWNYYGVTGTPTGCIPKITPATAYDPSRPVYIDITNTENIEPGRLHIGAYGASGLDFAPGDDISAALTAFLATSSNSYAISMYTTDAAGAYMLAPAGTKVTFYQDVPAPPEPPETSTLVEQVVLEISFATNYIPTAVVGSFSYAVHTGSAYKFGNLQPSEDYDDSLPVYMRFTNNATGSTVSSYRINFTNGGVKAPGDDVGPNFKALVGTPLTTAQNFYTAAANGNVAAVYNQTLTFYQMVDPAADPTFTGEGTVNDGASFRTVTAATVMGVGDATEGYVSDGSAWRQWFGEAK